jgi:hypothetical protein
MIESSERIGRAAFLSRIAGLFAVAVLADGPKRLGPRAVAGTEHPDPRPGINADHVLKAADLEPWSKEKDVAIAYDSAREFPEIFDGLACACGCYGKHGEHRSLLACYESKQPTGCGGCREVAKFVAGLARDRHSLEEIRAAYNTRFD